MASDINVTVFSGRLTRDAELKYSDTGTAVCSFSVASNYSRKQGDQWIEEVSYFDCVMFARRAEALHKYLTKGQQVVIDAEARQDRWEKDGQKRSKIKFYVQDIKLVGSKSDSGRAPDGTQPGDMGYTGSGADFEDDVPF